MGKSWGDKRAKGLSHYEDYDGAFRNKRNVPKGNRLTDREGRRLSKIAGKKSFYDNVEIRA